MQSSIVWGVTPCSPIEVRRYFGITYSPSSGSNLTQKMDVVRYFESSVKFYRTTWRYFLIITTVRTSNPTIIIEFIKWSRFLLCWISIQYKRPFADFVDNTNSCNEGLLRKITYTCNIRLMYMTSMNDMLGFKTLQNYNLRYRYIIQERIVVRAVYKISRDVFMHI